MMFSSRFHWDLRLNRLTVALQAKRRAGARVLDLTESNPTRADGLSTVEERYAGVLERLGDSSGALAAFSRSKKLMGDLLAAHPEQPRSRSSLRNCPRIRPGFRPPRLKRLRSSSAAETTGMERSMRTSGPCVMFRFT